MYKLLTLKILIKDEEYCDSDEFKCYMIAKKQGSIYCMAFHCNLQDSMSNTERGFRALRCDGCIEKTK